MAKIKWTPDTEIKENLARAKQMEKLDLEYLMQRIEQLEQALSQRMEKIEQSLKDSKEVLKQH
jgi:hypothetical protein